VRYWEGAVAVDGRAGDQKVGGRGYLEMTRYEPAALSPNPAPARERRE
jgi:hypothetical protein